MKSLNKLVMHPSFSDTIQEIRNAHISLVGDPIQTSFDLPDVSPSSTGDLILIEEWGTYDLSASSGRNNLNKLAIAGYDESKWEFNSLEGIAQFTTHSLVLHSFSNYIPVSLFSTYFYTKSKALSDGASLLKFSTDPTVDSNRQYAIDRAKFLIDFSPPDSILFIDGPLIGGQVSSYSIRSVLDLHTRGILPIFFVKNSTSDLTIDNIDELRGKFNSDMHWSSLFLQKGQRTSLMKYIDKHNPENTKVYCYLKAFNGVSPQRIEFHPETYAISSLNLIKYSILFII